MRITLIIAVIINHSVAIAQTNTEFIVKNRIDHNSSLAREPMVCEHPNGAIFVSGYRNDSDSPQLWKSNDEGKTWSSVKIGSIENGAIGNSDVDLFIDKKGTLYLVSMSFTKIPENTENFDWTSLKGERIDVGVSNDNGLTWNWQNISENEYDDRPWITASTDGTIHIIWNDGNGIHHKVSKDDGKSWEKKPDIAAKGGSSFLASGYKGQLAVRVAPISASAFKIDEGVDFVRYSLDNGDSWNDMKIPGKRVWTQDLSGIPRWVEPIVWDKEGNLHILWSEGKQLKLGITKDLGTSWEEYTVAESEDTLYFPYIELGNQGFLCTWVSGFGKDILHHAAFVQLKDKKTKTHLLDAQKLDIWSRFGTEQYTRSTGGEYFPIIQLANGNVGMVTTIQNSKAKREGFTWWELILNTF